MPSIQLMFERGVVGNVADGSGTGRVLRNGVPILILRDQIQVGDIVFADRPDADGVREMFPVRRVVRHP